MILAEETAVWSIGGMILTGETGVWSIGGMILTGETGVWSTGGMILTGGTWSMEHLWNDTDRGNLEYGALVE